MKTFWLYGGEVITPTEHRFVDLYVGPGGAALVEPGQAEGDEGDRIDCRGCYVTPGLFDLQVNGFGACNFWADPTEQEFAQFSRQLLANGVTDLLPTLITDELSHMRKNIGFLTSLGAGSLAGGPPGRGPEKNIFMPGIHLEGPFLSPKSRAFTQSSSFVT